MLVFLVLDSLSDFIQRCEALTEQSRPSSDDCNVLKVKGHQDLLHDNPEKSKKRKKKREGLPSQSRLNRLKMRIFG